MNKNNKYVTLAKREFWEHRGLWIAPVIGAGLMLSAALFGVTRINGKGIQMSLDPGAPTATGQNIGAVSLLGVATSIGLFAGIVTVFYLLDCLFAERKDRSILFWKSLPTSDAETVLTKLGVALVVMPLLVFALAAAMQPLLAGIVAIRFEPLRPYIGQSLIGSLQALPHLLGLWVVSLLWYAPVAIYLMLASVLARRTPMVYAVIPPVALGVAEKMLFDTQHVLRFVGGRLFPWPQQGPVVVHTEHGMLQLSHDWWKMFGEPALLLGVVAAAALAYAVIRLRRYRDDT